MSILQKYVMREMLAPLGLGLVVFTFVFLITRLFRLVDESINAGLSFRLVCELIGTFLPAMMSVTIPMSVLVAVLLGIGRLAADREILAIRMSGVNLLHICTPILVLSAILSVLLIYANQNLVPYLNLRNVDVLTQVGFNMLSSIPADRPYDLDTDEGGASSVFFYDSRDQTSGEMRGVSIKTQMESGDSGNKEPEKPSKAAAAAEVAGKAKGKGKGKGKVTSQTQALIEAARAKDKETRVREQLIVAESGRIVADMAKRLISVQLSSGSIHMINPDKPEAYTVVHFATFEKGVRPKLSDPGKKPRQMSVVELKAGMDAARKEAGTVKSSDKRKELRRRFGSLSTEYYQRFSIPLACLAFALIGIPLAVYVRPTGKAIAFAISFLLILLYYGLLKYGISLGMTGNRYAPFAIFFPNILLSVVGSYLLYRMVMK